MKRILIPLLLCLTMTGCSHSGSIHANFRAVEDLQLVQTFGFDWEDGEITITVSSGEETEKLPSSLLTASAPDIPQAIELLQDWSAREDLYFAHIRYVLVGEEAARHGLETLLDWFERGIQTRLDLPVFIVEGGTARDLICSGDDDLYEITAVLMSLERDVERRGKSWPFTLRELAARMDRCGAGLCTSVRTVETAENVPSAQEGITALETGFAVLRDWKLCAFSGQEAAEGICLLLNRAGAGNILLPGDGGGLVTLEMGRARTRMEPGPPPTIRANCRASVVSADAGTPVHAALLPLLEEELGQWVAQRLEAALQLSRETEADFLDLGTDTPPTLLINARVERSYDILFAENAAEVESHGG